jgi:arginase
MRRWGDNRGMLKLLVAEWQGYGLTPEVADGATALARVWWGDTAAAVDVPRTEALAVEEGVLGLASIAPRTGDLLAALTDLGPATLQMVAGTCGAEVAPVAYLNDRYVGDLAVVWLDGHADLNTPESSPSGHFHGMVLRTLLGDGPAALTAHVPTPLRPEQVFLVGPRDMDEPEQAYINDRPVTWMRDEAFGDPERLIAAIAAAGFRHVYVHFDVDVINPNDFGNALMRADGGPTLAEVADVLSALHRHTTVVGFSVLEYCDRTPSDRDRLVTTLRALDAPGCC